MRAFELDLARHVVRPAKERVRVARAEKTVAVAFPPLNSPLNGVTVIDHGCAVPSQIKSSGNSPAEPEIVAIRPTDCVTVALRKADAPAEQVAVPVSVAVPAFV